MKTTKEMMGVMQAYADGKEIECRSIGSNSNWYNTATPAWNWLDWDYRVKPASKYRPYDTTKELLNDYIKRFQKANISFITEINCPLIYLKPKNSGYFYIIEVFADNRATIRINGEWHDLTDIFENYEFVDGSPVGKFEAN